MGKNKKKKKDKEPDILFEFDKALDQKYMDLLEEIQFMQADIKREERKAKKKAIKKMKKGNNFYDTRMEIKVREDIIRRMEGDNFFDRVTKAIEDVRPICLVIARLVMSLILAILSIDAVKYRVKPETLDTMHSIYTLAHKVSVA